jgi:hypothetical protein
MSIPNTRSTVKGPCSKLGLGLPWALSLALVTK